ncbi:MAG TPA: hypothetical protein VGN90_06235 [Pyrinomonadaceae bacterium]|jgi:hypothetical protein|nr:hypothetical protein [Pyrinomonadaceae bacterium]
MKLRLSLVLILFFGSAFTSRILAQDTPTTPAQAAADLRARLAEVQSREAELQTRLNQLDEALKPENIERSMAGIGSTRPEELREQRRRELTIEKDGVRRQLDLLATNRARLETAIQAADSRAYQESAQGFNATQFISLRMASVSPRRVVIASVVFFGLLGIGALAVFIRRR